MSSQDIRAEAEKYHETEPFFFGKLFEETPRMWPMLLALCVRNGVKCALRMTPRIKGE